MAEEKAQKPLSFVLSDEVQNSMAEDEGLAKAVAKFMEVAKAADELVKAGKFPDLDTAMDSLGFHAEPVDPDKLSDEVRESIENVTFNKKPN